MKPSEEEALRLHRKHGSSDRIVEHCKAVDRVAEILGEEILSRGRAVDMEAIRAGALLHDIGRNRVQTVRHGLEGAEMLMSEGVDAVVVDIVRKHVGAGISPEEAEALGFPGVDCIPRSMEELIVCFADKMVDASAVRPFEEEVKRFERKGLNVERLLELRRRVQMEVGGDPELLIFDKTKESQ